MTLLDAQERQPLPASEAILQRNTLWKDQVTEAIGQVTNVASRASPKT